MAVVGVCEDDVALRGVLVAALKGAGHDVVATGTGEQAVRLLGKESGVQVVVLDIGLPDADGRDVCLALRAAGQPAPVLFLTALGAVHERLAGFHAGGDDYLTKPFAVSELLVRLEALARRAPTPTPTESGLRLDAGKHAITFGAAEVRLSPTEFRLCRSVDRARRLPEDHVLIPSRPGRADAGGRDGHRGLRDGQCLPRLAGQARGSRGIRRQRSR